MSLDVESDRSGVDEIVMFDVNKEISNFPLVPYMKRLYVIEEEVVKSHGLFIPETSRKEGEMQTNIGLVVAIGEGVTFAKPGDRVLYARYSGSWVLNKKFRVMNEEDLLGRFK